MLQVAAAVKKRRNHASLRAPKGSLDPMWRGWSAIHGQACYVNFLGSLMGNDPVLCGRRKTSCNPLTKQGSHVTFIKAHLEPQSDVMRLERKDKLVGLMWVYFLFLLFLFKD